jgi:hypothetical protein
MKQADAVFVFAEGAGAFRPLKEECDNAGLQARAFSPLRCFAELAFLFLIRHDW